VLCLTWFRCRLCLESESSQRDHTWSEKLWSYQVRLCFTVNRYSSEVRTIAYRLYQVWEEILRALLYFEQCILSDRFWFTSVLYWARADYRFKPRYGINHSSNQSHAPRANIGGFTAEIPVDTRSKTNQWITSLAAPKSLPRVTKNNCPKNHSRSRPSQSLLPHPKRRAPGKSPSRRRRDLLFPLAQRSSPSCWQSSGRWRRTSLMNSRSSINSSTRSNRATLMPIQIERI